MGGGAELRLHLADLPEAYDRAGLSEGGWGVQGDNKRAVYLLMGSLWGIHRLLELHPSASNLGWGFHLGLWGVVAMNSLLGLPRTIQGTARRGKGVGRNWLKMFWNQ